ncbi:hypothetical protein ACLOJK_029088 [Asimina triloba]
MHNYELMVLTDLIKKGHPDPEKKNGIRAFQVRFHPMWQSRCFFIMREDGHCDDFSFRKCVDKILPLPPHMKANAGNARSGGHYGGGRGGGGGGGGGGRGGGGGGRGGGRFRGGRGRGRRVLDVSGDACTFFISQKLAERPSIILDLLVTTFLRAALVELVAGGTCLGAMAGLLGLGLSFEVQPVPILRSRPEIPQTLKQQIVCPDPSTPSVSARCLHPAVAQIVPPAGRLAAVFVTCLEVVACQPTTSSCSTELETATTPGLNLPHHLKNPSASRQLLSVSAWIVARAGPVCSRSASAAINTSRLSPSASGSSCRLSTSDSPPVVQHMSTEADPAHLASVQRPGYVAHLARSRRRRRRQQRSSPAASSPVSSRSAQVRHLCPRRQSAAITWPVRSPTPAGSLVAPAACRLSASRRRS